MAVEPPPFYVAWRVNRTLPGVYGWFVQAVIDAVGDAPVTLTSWHRNAVENVRVGGDPASQHLVGLAVDLVASPSRREELVRRAQLVGLQPVAEASHVHIQALPAGTLTRLGLL